jgi:hypothetical protein
MKMTIELETKDLQTIRETWPAVSQQVACELTHNKVPENVQDSSEFEDVNGKNKCTYRFWVDV